MKEQKINYTDELAISAGKKTKERDYWLNQLAGEPVKSSFTPDSSNHLLTGEELNYEKLKISGELFSMLIKLSKNSDYTLYVTLLSGLILLIYKYTGMKDIMVGSPIFKQKVMGDFLNTVLPLRQRIHGDMSFKELLLQVRQTVQGAVEHQNYPMEVLLYHLELQDTGEGFPLFDIALLLENIHDHNYLKDIHLNTVFSIFKDENHIDISLQYNGQIYRKNTMERIGRHFVNSLSSALANIQLPLGSLEIMTEQEKRLLLMNFNNNHVDFPQDKTAADFIANQAVKNPHHTALEFAGQKVSYKRLNENAWRLAVILKEKGVSSDRAVGILLNRSVIMVESILAAWYAGGAYIPISADYPGERIWTILEDSHAAILITDTVIAFTLGIDKDYPRLASQLMLIDEIPGELAAPSPIDKGPACRPGDLAYIIYTSGSTGRPKGVMVEHLGMMNHLDAKTNILGLNSKSCLAQNASHTFDISVWQFFSALLHGGKTVIYTNDMVLDPDRFIKHINIDKVTVLEVVPSYLSVMLDSLEQSKPNRPFDSLEYLLVTGEEVKSRLVERWFALYPEIKMVNAYGPTEASDDITHFIITEPPSFQLIPIGKPVQNFNIYIVDEKLNLCPVGVKGELCVSGIGVGRGYLNNPELTAEKFDHHFTNHFALPPARAYRTGDLARWLPDGTIEFFGRKDYQVKIRGYRIELPEIENRLMAHPQVNGAAIVVKEKEGMEKELYAFFTAREIGSGKIPDAGHLRDYLAGGLPGYMIPAQFIKIEKLPLTANGKIDRKALEKMEVMDINIAYTPPATEMEKIVGKIWQEVLKLDKVSIYDIFFQLGGNSLTAITVASALKKAGFDASLIDIITNPTIYDLARAIEKKNSLNQSAAEMAEDKLLSRLPCIEKLNKGRHKEKIFIIHPLHGMVYQYKELALVLEPDYNVYGIQARGVTPGSKMAESPQQMIDDYIRQILEIQKDGSIIIAGYCISSIIAYEIARKLEELEHPVKKLLLFDPHFLFTRLGKSQGMLKYLPNFLKRTILFYFNRNFKKEIQAKLGNTDRSNLSDDKIEDYIRVLGDHVISMGFIKIPVLIIQAEAGPYTFLTEKHFSIITKNKTTLISVPGDHDSIWEKPYVNKLAEVIINNP